jgi:hypothetical protein
VELGARQKITVIEIFNGVSGFWDTRERHGTDTQKIVGIYLSSTISTPSRSPARFKDVLDLGIWAPEVRK